MAPTGRTPYTEADSNHLIRYLARYNPDGAGRSGNALYKTLVENAEGKWPWSERHTWQSWRDHYYKNQEDYNRKIKIYLRSKKPKHDTKSVSDDPPPEKPKKRRASGIEEQQNGKRVKLSSNPSAKVGPSSNKEVAKNVDKKASSDNSKSKKKERAPQSELALSSEEDETEAQPDESRKRTRETEEDEVPVPISSLNSGADMGVLSDGRTWERGARADTTTPPKAPPTPVDNPTPVAKSNPKRSPEKSNPAPNSSPRVESKSQPQEASPKQKQRPIPKRKAREEADPFVSSPSASGSPEPVSQERVSTSSRGKPPTYREGPFRSTIDTGKPWPPVRNHKKVKPSNEATDKSGLLEATSSALMPPPPMVPAKVNNQVTPQYVVVSTAASSSKSKLPPGKYTSVEEAISSASHRQTPRGAPRKEIVGQSASSKHAAREHVRQDQPIRVDKPPSKAPRPRVSQTFEEPEVTDDIFQAEEAPLSARRVEPSVLEERPTGPKIDLNDKRFRTRRQSSISSSGRNSASSSVQRRQTRESSLTSTSTWNASRFAPRRSSLGSTVSVPEGKEAMLQSLGHQVLAGIAKRHGYDVDVAVNLYEKLGDVQRVDKMLGELTEQTERALHAILVKEGVEEPTKTPGDTDEEDEWAGEMEDEEDEGDQPKVESPPPERKRASSRRRSFAPRPSLTMRPLPPNAERLDSYNDEYTPPRRTKAGKFARHEPERKAALDEEVDDMLHFTQTQGYYADTSQHAGLRDEPRERSASVSRASTVDQESRRSVAREVDGRQGSGDEQFDELPPSSPPPGSVVDEEEADEVQDTIMEDEDEDSAGGEDEEEQGDYGDYDMDDEDENEAVGDHGEEGREGHNSDAYEDEPSGDFDGLFTQKEGEGDFLDDDDERQGSVDDVNSALEYALTQPHEDRFRAFPQEERERHRNLVHYATQVNRENIEYMREWEARQDENCLMVHQRLFAETVGMMIKNGDPQPFDLRGVFDEDDEEEEY